MTIGVLTTVAAVLLFVLGGLVIRIFLGGGAFDDEDLIRTSGVLAVFAFAVPLESVTHLLARALYATKNTVLPTAASIVGFVATVIAANLLAPRFGLAAIPAGFAIGMGVKVTILAVALAPRIAAIGRPADPEWLAGMARLAPPPSSGRILRSRLAVVGIAAVAIGVGIGAIQGAGQALSGATLQYAPEVTPWARVAAPVARSPEPAASVRPSPTATPRPHGSGKPKPAASPTPGGPFSMDLYDSGDFVGEFKDVWCLPAAMQTAMNVMDVGGDHTRATQGHLFDLARSIAPAPDGAAEPEAWAAGLTQLGYGNYEVRSAGSIGSAVRLVATHIRDTNRPAGLLVWRGAHSWVVSGFTATQPYVRVVSLSCRRGRAADRGRVVPKVLNHLGLLPPARRVGPGRPAPRRLPPVAATPRQLPRQGRHVRHRPSRDVGRCDRAQPFRTDLGRTIVTWGHARARPNVEGVRQLSRPTCPCSVLKRGSVARSS